MRNQKVNAQIYTKAHAKNKISTWMFEIQTLRKITRTEECSAH